MTRAPSAIRPGHPVSPRLQQCIRPHVDSGQSANVGIEEDRDVLGRFDSRLVLDGFHKLVAVLGGPKYVF
ncbi:hypothetical protein ANO14919_120630 [Xylariales sp. No.14919]|nr:hypothetical protein ANO14919_120630 [Xylariales sp. No.14919]